MNEHDRHSLTQGFQSPFVEETAPEVTRLFVLAGPISGASFVIDVDETSIGRRPECTVCIPSKSVSKTHCTIERRSDKGDKGCHGYVIVDAGSTNGTQVNGRTLAPDSRLRLTNGDTIAICDTTFIFLDGGSASKSGRPERIDVDTRAVAAEAGSALDECSEALAIAKERRDRRRQTRAPSTGR